MPSRIAAAKHIAGITVEALRQHVVTSNTPLRLTGLAAKWPALEKWTASDRLARIRQAAGEHRQVEVEIASTDRGYLDEGHEVLSMPLGESLETKASIDELNR